MCKQIVGGGDRDSFNTVKWCCGNLKFGGGKIWISSVTEKLSGLICHSFISSFSATSSSFLLTMMVFEKTFTQAKTLVFDDDGWPFKGSAILAVYMALCLCVTRLVVLYRLG